MVSRRGSTHIFFMGSWPGFDGNVTARTYRSIPTSLLSEQMLRIAGDAVALISSHRSINSGSAVSRGGRPSSNCSQISSFVNLTGGLYAGFAVLCCLKVISTSRGLAWSKTLIFQTLRRSSRGRLGKQVKVILS